MTKSKEKDEVLIFLDRVIPALTLEERKDFCNETTYKNDTILKSIISYYIMSIPYIKFSKKYSNNYISTYLKKYETEYFYKQLTNYKSNYFKDLGYNQVSEIYDFLIFSENDIKNIFGICDLKPFLNKLIASYNFSVLNKGISTRDLCILEDELHNPALKNNAWDINEFRNEIKAATNVDEISDIIYKKLIPVVYDDNFKFLTIGPSTFVFILKHLFLEYSGNTFQKLFEKYVAYKTNKILSKSKFSSYKDYKNYFINNFEQDFLVENLHGKTFIFEVKSNKIDFQKDFSNALNKQIVKASTQINRVKRHILNGNPIRTSDSKLVKIKEKNKIYGFIITLWDYKILTFEPEKYEKKRNSVNYPIVSFFNFEFMLRYMLKDKKNFSEITNYFDNYNNNYNFERNHIHYDRLFDIEEFINNKNHKKTNEYVMYNSILLENQRYLFLATQEDFNKINQERYSVDSNSFVNIIKAKIESPINTECMFFTPSFVFIVQD